MDIDLHFLRHAAALNEFKNFGMAAKFLNLSQPALSRSIHTLENRLGVQLFIRGTKSVDPTDYGRLFLERAKQLLSAADNFNKQIIITRQQKYEHLIIGCGPYPADGVVAPTMARYLQAHPMVEQKIYIRGPEDLVLALQNSKLEFFISETSDLSDRTDLHITPMIKHKAYFVARPGHPLAASKPSLEQIFHFPIAMPSRLATRAYGPIFSAWKSIDAKNRQPLPAIECVSLSILKKIVKESDGITVLPLYGLEADLENGSLVILSTESWLHTNYGFVSRKDNLLSPQANAFKKLLFEEDLVLQRGEKRMRGHYKLD